MALVRERPPVEPPVAVGCRVASGELADEDQLLEAHVLDRRLPPGRLLLAGELRLLAEDALDAELAQHLLLGALVIVQVLPLDGEPPLQPVRAELAPLLEEARLGCHRDVRLMLALPLDYAPSLIPTIPLIWFHCAMWLVKTTYAFSLSFTPASIRSDPRCSMTTSDSLSRRARNRPHRLLVLRRVAVLAHLPGPVRPGEWRVPSRLLSLPVLWFSCPAADGSARAERGDPNVQSLLF